MLFGVDSTLVSKLQNFKISELKYMKILTSTWFLAIIIASIIFAFTYQNFKEFSVEKISEVGKNNEDYRFFYDIDNDLIDDNIDIKYFETVESMGVSVSNINGRILHTGIITPYKFPLFFTEPYCLSKKEDNIGNLLYLIELNEKIYLATNSFDTLMEQVFLDSIYSGGEYVNVPAFYDYGYLGTYDVNNDGFGELFIYIAEGYRIFPRRLYCVDYHNNKLLYKSILFGAFPLQYEQFLIDSSPYFVVGSLASSNMGDFRDSLLNDFTSYFMVFDEFLKFKFEPIKMGNESSVVSFFQKEIENQQFFLVFANPIDESENVDIKQIDLKGNIVKEMQFPTNMKAIFGGIFSIENNIFYIDKDFNYHKFNILTEKDEFIKFNFADHPFWLKSQDIDGDGKDEHLFRDKASNKVYVTRNNFSKPAQIELPLNEISKARYYFPKQEDGKNIIFVWTYTTYYTFEYVSDKFYLLKLFGFLTILFIGTFIFVWIISSILKYRLKQQAKITSRLKELEFQNVRSQMNPHFILNTLNLISSSVLKNEKEKAYDVITGFSNIIRSTLMDSNKIMRSLDEEVKFVEDYLKIQKHRFKQKFDFEINNKDVDLQKVNVPPFIIQIFAENALKHGLKDINEGGLINISINKIDKNIVIEIDDNGVGHKAAKQNPNRNSTGKGLKLTKEYIKLINSLNKEKISLEIIDKIEDNEAKGLTVKILIPENLKN